MFPCSSCPKTFSNASNARRHEHNAHPDKANVSPAVEALRQPITALGAISASSSSDPSPSPVPSPSSRWRCCAVCGKTANNLSDYNQHVADCQGGSAAATMRATHNLTSDIMARWQDAPSEGVDSERAMHHASLPNLQEFSSWLQSPAGYGSLGTLRCVKSRRTLQIVHEDLSFLVSFQSSQPPSWAAFCDQKVMAETISKVVAVARSPSRMYNILTACEKVCPAVVRDVLHL
jgi:hypothetical protein